mgnify:CR=1 FL=1
MTEMITTTSTQAPFAKPWGNYLLEKLVETQAPESISWLPQTLGWKLLAGIALLLLIRKSYRLYQDYQRNTYRREALAWLKQCQQTDGFDLYMQLPSLLRKTALNAYKRTEITQLTGIQWEQWLDRQCQQTSFSTSCPNVLHQLSYKPINLEDVHTDQYQVLLEQIRLWIKHHRRSNA